MHFPRSNVMIIRAETGQVVIAQRRQTLRNLCVGVFATVLILAGVVAMQLADAQIHRANAQSSCQIDFGILQKSRMVHIAALNKQAKARKGRLDPRRACPALRKLVAAETKMLNYMKKNKAWCNIPDKPIEQMTQTRSRTAKLAGQACRAARAARRGPPRGTARRAPPRPKLPSGPL